MDIGQKAGRDLGYFEIPDPPVREDRSYLRQPNEREHCHPGRGVDPLLGEEEHPEQMGEDDRLFHDWR